GAIVDSNAFLAPLALPRAFRPGLRPVGAGPRLLISIGGFGDHVDYAVLGLAAGIGLLQMATNSHFEGYGPNAFANARRQLDSQRLKQRDAGGSFDRRRRNT